MVQQVKYVTFTELHNVEDTVNVLMKEGWELCGGVASLNNAYTQTLTRKLKVRPTGRANNQIG